MIELPGDLGEKIKWAERRLQELDERVREYASSNPIDLEARAEDQFELGKQFWSVWARVRTPPPVELSLLAGDVVQNTRAALDYLAQALVRTAGGQPHDGPGGTQFPIATKRPKRPLTITGCADEAVLRQVAALQPYLLEEPDRHPLARLNALNNTNKHQTIPVLTGAGGVPAVIAIHHESKNPADTAPRGTVAGFARWFFNGDRLDPIRGLFPPNAVPRAEGEFETVVALSADAWLTVSMVDELDFYLRFVRDHTIPLFRHFFKEPWPEDVFTPEPLADPSASLPEFDKDRYEQMIFRMMERLGYKRLSDGGSDASQPPVVFMGVLPGVSVAMGYVTGGTPLAGPLAPEFGGPHPRDD